MTESHLKLYLTSLAAFLAIDALWIGLVANAFYKNQIGYLLKSDPDWVAAGIFYLLFVLGIQIFVLLPGLQARSLRFTLARAAFFGLVTYATYDLTNLATVKDWPVLVTVVDLIWGAVLSSAVSLVGYLLGRRWFATLRPAGKWD